MSSSSFALPPYPKCTGACVYPSSARSEDVRGASRGSVSVYVQDPLLSCPGALFHLFTPCHVTWGRLSHQVRIETSITAPDSLHLHSVSFPSSWNFLGKSLELFQICCSLAFGSKYHLKQLLWTVFSLHLSWCLSSTQHWLIILSSLALWDNSSLGLRPLCSSFWWFIFSLLAFCLLLLAYMLNFLCFCSLSPYCFHLPELSLDIPSLYWWL